MSACTLVRISNNSEWRESPADVGNLAEPRKSVSRGLTVWLIDCLVDCACVTIPNNWYQKLGFCARSKIEINPGEEIIWIS